MTQPELNHQSQSCLLGCKLNKGLRNIFQAPTEFDIYGQIYSFTVDVTELFTLTCSKPS